MDLSFFIRGSIIHAVLFGTGDKLLICFHGFGEDAEKFRSLEPALGSHYTVVSIDLPFHGKTRWQKDDFFYPDDLKKLINEILQTCGKKKFSLMGYSLGGKIVFAAIEPFAGQIDEVILVAPDGVKTIAWYDVAVYPAWGRALFRRFVENPRFVFSLARLLRSSGVIGERLFNFLKMQTDSEEKRQKVYDVWMAIRYLKSTLSDIKNLLNTHGIKSYIFIGRYDRVITTRIGNRFSEGLKHNKLLVLEKGHNLITDALNDPLKKTLEI